MTIGMLKQEIEGLPDSAEIDVVLPDGRLLLLVGVEPSDINNTIAFMVNEPS